MSSNKISSNVIDCMGSSIIYQWLHAETGGLSSRKGQGASLPIQDKPLATLASLFVSYQKSVCLCNGR